ncbi:MAG: helix-turn-helix transcriptional regulator [Colwellia sp.]|nr:helix-turn-helix transcriptional regulator [Colwellia sp.]
MQNHQLHKLSPNLSPERVKYFRKDNGWSQELLAKAAGLSLRTIQRAEKDGNSSVETQLALAAAFDISPKELFPVSSNPDVNWKRKNIMQSFLALLVVSGAVILLALLAGGISMFVDAASILFILFFMYAATVIAFGSSGLIKSLKGLSYLFATDISPTPATEFLSLIFKKQIFFIYGAAFIGLLLGSIAIHTNVAETIIFHRAYAVNLLVLLYAAIFAEGILRPLSTKLEHRYLAAKFD